MRACLAGLDDDVARDELDVLVAEGAQHGEAGVVGGGERAVAPVGSDEFADVGDGFHVFEETAVWAGHVLAHVLDEAVGRGGDGAAVRVGGVGSSFAGRPVFYAEDDVEELDDGALGVAAAAELYVGLLAGAIVEHDTVGETSITHVLASGEEGSDTVVEDVWIAALVHALEKSAELV